MSFYIKLVKLTQKQYVHFSGWMEEFYVSFVYGSVNTALHGISAPFICYRVRMWLLRSFQRSGSEV